MKRVVDAAKEVWICKVALEAESARKDSQKRWKCIRQLQLTYRGRMPRRPTAILKEDGELTTSPEEVKVRWYDHFKEILNIPSDFCHEVIDEIPSFPPIRSWMTPPHYGRVDGSFAHIE